MNRDKVGQKIKEARRSKGMSQEALGAQCGVSGAAVKKWEKGETFPTRDRWPVLERELGLPRDWFYSQQLPTDEQSPSVTVRIGGPGNVVQTGDVNNGTVAGVLHQTAPVNVGRASSPVGGDIARELCGLIAEHLAGKTMDEQIEFRARVKQFMEDEGQGGIKQKP